MKRLFLLILSFVLAFSLCGCGESTDELEKTDELAVPFTEALLLGDTEKMKEYIHPDYMESALPDEEFYAYLAENHFFSLGNKLTSLSATAKTYINETSMEGTLLDCAYLIMTNELYYDLSLMILDNERGYGVIAVSMNLNTNVDLYIPEGEQQ